MTKQERDELRKILAKRTPGEWGEGDGCCGPYLDYQAHDDERGGPFPISDYHGREPVWLGGVVSEPDRKAIAAAVNASDALLDLADEADRLREERTEYDNAVRACAYLGYELSKYAASSRERNQREFLEGLGGLFDQCGKVQAAFQKILDAERAALARPATGEVGDVQ